MSSIPLIPDNAPFNAEQRAWLNGFLAGLFSRQNPSPLVPSLSPAAALQPLTILFGSQTGSAENLAKKTAKEAGKRGFAPTILDMAQATPAKLVSEQNLLIITSTYGDGEPPDNAKALHTALRAADAPKLPSTLRYSVLALGDTNYAQFCQCGKDFDAALEKLGATRATPRTDCDVDYEKTYAHWLDTTLAALAPSEVGTSGPLVRSDSPISNHESQISNESGYSRSHPYPALLLTSKNLNAPGSAKQINHIEFDLADSGLAYEAGDALGVIPHNDPALVSDLLVALNCDGEEAIPSEVGTSGPLVRSETTTLRRALTELYDLGKPTPALLERLKTGKAEGLQTQAAANSSEIRTAGLQPGPCVTATSDSALQPFSPSAFHVLDALLALPTDARPKPADLPALLKKLQPRLYSISSSPKAHPGQVHLTVGAVRYEAANRKRTGVCSTYLADRATPGTTKIGVFVHSNKAFRPPADPSAPMIMVGPGTGIAPFRAFLEERAATDASGQNWLFFGDQKSSTDFIYRDQLEALQKSGHLHRLSLAFSRDQPEKIYVQTRMLEAAAELYAWLEKGAYFYVCGDASKMAKDVDAALHQVIELAGQKSPEQAAAYIQSLKTAKRYQRDVY